VAATVLVCDDQPVLRELVRAALGEGDYEIVEAHDGDESLEVARRVRPDLIVLDMVMPGRSGIDVLAEIRRDPRIAKTPVVMCTASTRSLDRDAASEFGADRYLPKPFSPLELVAIVEELLDGRA
jgi:CheY-like chemotaxis protein